MRGVPAECEYGTTKHDRGFIEQSDLIEELRAKVKKLEQKLAEHNGIVSKEIAALDRPTSKVKIAAVDESKKVVSKVRYLACSVTFLKYLR